MAVQRPFSGPPTAASLFIMAAPHPLEPALSRPTSLIMSGWNGRKAAVRTERCLSIYRRQRPSHPSQKPGSPPETAELRNAFISAGQARMPPHSFSTACAWQTHLSAAIHEIKVITNDGRSPPASWRQVRVFPSGASVFSRSIPGGLSILSRLTTV
jgi:hypothetical protein